MINVNPPGSPSSVTYSSVGGALTGLALWALSTYAFRSHVVPGPVEGAAWVLIPGAVAWISSWFTRKAARIEGARHGAQGTREAQTAGKLADTAAGRPSSGLACCHASPRWRGLDSTACHGRAAAVLSGLAFTPSHQYSFSC